MYKPADDTFLMEDTIKNYHGSIALEIGIGSGYLTRVLCSNFRFVIGVDLDLDSVLYAKNHSLIQFNNKLLICSDLVSFLNIKVDLIISNPPYLPSDNDNLADNTIYGGKTGIETTLRILQASLPILSDSGRVVIMRSSLSDDKKINDLVIKHHLLKQTKACKKYFFENLEILEISKKKTNITTVPKKIDEGFSRVIF